MEEIQSRLAGAGCRKLNLQIRADNVDAVAFYRALGFNVEDRISMGKRLDDR
jgi:ribosomal protein S18 acetylase RimI-like enzyme